VKTAKAPPPLDPLEPENTADAIASWGVGYIVITSVDRDDLPDQGSAHLRSVVQHIKQKSPHVLVEVLSPGAFRETHSLGLGRTVHPSQLSVFVGAWTCPDKACLGKLSAYVGVGPVCAQVVRCVGCGS